MLQTPSSIGARAYYCAKVQLFFDIRKFRKRKVHFTRIKKIFFIIIWIFVKKIVLLQRIWIFFRQQHRIN